MSLLSFVSFMRTLGGSGTRDFLLLIFRSLFALVRTSLGSPNPIDVLNFGKSSEEEKINENCRELN
jgi:hypothetical protein